MDANTTDVIKFALVCATICVVIWAGSKYS
jgi:hypothetical protein